MRFTYSAHHSFALLSPQHFGLDLSVQVTIWVNTNLLLLRSQQDKNNRNHRQKRGLLHYLLYNTVSNIFRYSSSFRNGALLFLARLHVLGPRARRCAECIAMKYGRYYFQKLLVILSPSRRYLIGDKSAQYHSSPCPASVPRRAANDLPSAPFH